MSKEIFVNTLNVNDSFSSFFMLKSCEIRVGSNGKTFFDVTLGDRTGEINGKKWDITGDEESRFSLLKPGDTVWAKAQVSEWNGSLQLKILSLRKAQKEDKLEMSDYVKTAPIPAEEMYSHIFEEAEKISDEGLRRVAVSFLSENKEKLLYFPGAMKNHHAEMAGLLYHITRMLELGKHACEVYSCLNKDWIVCGVIIHDMEKLGELESNEYGISSGYTLEGQLLGHISQGVVAVSKLAEKAGLDSEKTLMLEHMILSHHYEAEFGSPRKPLFPEAEMLHYLDMVDAKLYDFENALSAVEPGSFSERVRTLDGRMLYKPSFAEK